MFLEAHMFLKTLDSGLGDFRATLRDYCLFGVEELSVVLGFSYIRRRVCCSPNFQMEQERRNEN